MNAQFLFQTHAGDWRLQIFLDVVGEGAQRRNIDTAHSRFQRTCFEFANQRVEHPEESG